MTDTIARRARNTAARRLALIALVAGLAVGPGRALAQGPNAELQAADLFDQGNALREAGDWTGACEAFAESQRLSPAVATQLNLAKCSVRGGRLLEAAAILNAAIDAAQAKNDRLRRDRARADLATVVVMIPRIAFEVPAGARATATIDDVPVRDLAVATLVDPGRHEIVVIVDGKVRIDRMVTLDNAAIERIQVGPSPAGAETGGPGAVPAAPAPSGPSTRNRHRGLVIGTGAGAAALAIAGSYLLVSAYGLEDDSYAKCPMLTTCNAVDGAAAIELSRRAVSRQELATGVLVGAGVAGGVAAVLWWTGRPQRTVVDVAPTAGGAAVLVRGGF